MERVEIVRLHVDDGKTASTIVRLFKDRGITVPEGTVYTLIRKQARNLLLCRSHKKARPTTYSEADSQLVVQAQRNINDTSYQQLKTV